MSGVLRVGVAGPQLSSTVRPRRGSGSLQALRVEPLIGAHALPVQAREVLRQRIAEHSRALLQTARALAEFDVLEQALPFNCEHAVPQTLFDRREPMRGDLHHQFTREVGDTPTDPWDRSGPVARAVLYFLVRYPGVVDEALVPDLIMWHERDPVSTHEQHRNAAIAEIQGNRNPFIDHPGWALDV